MKGRRWNRDRSKLWQMNTGATEGVVADSDQFLPDDDAKKIFAAFKVEAEKRQLSSSENFDKSILTYSSAGLGVSLAFLKDFVPISNASYASLLYLSWLFFVLATSLTIFSFLVSERAQAVSIKDAEEYYLKGNAEYLNKSRWHNKYIAYSNSISGVAFVAALLLSSLFVGLNLDVKKSVLENKGSASQLIKVTNYTENSILQGAPSSSSLGKRSTRSQSSKPKQTESVVVSPNTFCKEKG